MKTLDLFKLDGKVSLVTGGASGIGFNFAEGLAEAGSDIIICGRGKHGSLPEAAEKLSKPDINVYHYECDVSNPSSIDKMCEKVEEDIGKLDILVNNAGITWGAPTEDMPLENWQQVISTNLTGIFYLSQQVARKFFIPEQKGNIIMISSVAAFKGGELGIIGYAASKSGMIGMVNQLAVEWANHGIRINAIAPSWFPSRMSRHFTNEDSPFYEEIISRIPMGRIGKPDELKGVVVFLASDASSYVTGSTIPVDGGYLAK